MSAIGNVTIRSLIAIASGLIVGCLTSFGQGHLGRTGDAFVNSASAWLVAPFVVGACTPTIRGAALAGLTACLMQLVGYELTAQLRGIGVSGSLFLFWGACGAVGGPVFGGAGALWRRGRGELRGGGPALMGSAFIAEGLWLYLHELHYYTTAVLWILIGGAIAATLLRGLREYRWLGLTIPAGLIGEVLLTRIYV